MYQVNVEKIEQHLTYLEKVLSYIAPVVQNEQRTEEGLAMLALERALHIALETVADVGNYLIDGFIMRDPGSYEDIVDILEDETVIVPDMAVALRHVVNTRKLLVTTYTDVDSQTVKTMLHTHFTYLQQFPEAVREYLKKELS